MTQRSENRHSAFRVWRARLTGPTARMGGWAVADQALVSGTNFLTGLLLARYTTKSEFGVYVLAYSAMIFMNELQGALITGPMMVLGAAREEEEFSLYATTLGVVQLAAGVALALIAFAAVGVMALIPSTEGLRGAFLGIAAAVFFVQIQEFVRRVLFTRLRPAATLANDLIFRGLQLAGVAGLLVLGRRAGAGEAGWLGARNAFLVMAGAAALAGAFGVFQVREYLRMGLAGARGFLKENWRFGRWGLISSGVTVGYTQAMYVILGAFAGTEGVASLEGPRLVVAPCILVMIGWSNVVGPVAARKFALNGPRSMVRFLRGAAVPLLLLVGAILTVVLVFPTEALSLVLGRKFGAETPVLIIWAMTVLLMAFSTAIAGVFAASRRPELSTACRAIGAAIGLPACFLFVWIWGVAGAAFARLTVQAAIALAVAFLAVRLIRRLSEPPIAARPGRAIWHAESDPLDTEGAL